MTISRRAFGAGLAGAAVGIGGRLRRLDATPVATNGLHLRLAGPVSLVTTLDPALVRDSETMMLVRQLSRGLMAFNVDLSVRPELAEALHYDVATRTYTAILREGISFHDGRPIEAVDVERSFTRALNPATAGGDRSALAAASQLAGIVGARELLGGGTEGLAGVRVIDRRTIAITLSEADSAFPAKLASVAASIVHMVGSTSPGASPSASGSGPFRRNVDHSVDALTMMSSSGWYQGHGTVSSLSFLTGPEAALPTNLLQRGDIDIGTGLSAADALLLADPASGSGDLEIVATPAFSLLYLALSPQEPPLDDPHIRRAIQVGFPWARLAEASAPGVQVAQGVIPPGMLARSWNATLPAYDPDAALAAIAASRYGHAERVPPITIWTGQTSAADPLRNVGVALQEVLGERLGLRVNPVSVAWGDFLAGLPAGRFPTHSLTWVADYPDPAAILGVLFESDSPDNYSGYQSQTFDRLLTTARSTDDAEEREDAFARAQQVVIDDAVVIPIAFDIGYTAYRTGIDRVPVTPIGLVGLETIIGT